MLLLVTSLARTAGADPVQLVTADDRGVTLKLVVEPYVLGPSGEDGRREILIPQLYLLDAPGRPKLPYATAVIAVPLGAGITATVIGEGAEEVVDGVRLTLGERGVVRVEPEGLGYSSVREPVPPIQDGAWPRSPVEVGEPFTVRRQRMVVVQLQPFRYDVDTERLWTRRELTVRVSFTGARSGPSAAGAAEDRGFEPIFESTVLNYEQGRAWREARPVLGRGLFARPQGLRAGPPGTVAVAAFDEDEPEVRVRIAQTGAWALSADSLLDKGYPAGVPIDEVSVHRHEYVPSIAAPNPPYVTFEVRVEVEDADGDGFFTAGDNIVFYAQSWWERSGLAYAASHAQRSWGEADFVYATRVNTPRQGLRIQTRSGWGGLTLTPLPSYPYYQRWEQNTSYNSAPRDTMQDPYMWITNPLFATPTELTFETHDIDTSQPASAGLFWVGLLNSYDHYLWAAVRNQSGLQTAIMDSAFLLGKGSVARYGVLPGTALSEGATNRMRIWGKSQDPFGAFAPRANIGLIHFEVSYWRGYRAIQGSLSCNNAYTSGNYEISATGFSDSSLLRVYDVTDSSAIRRLIATPKDLVGGEYTVRFQDNAAPGVERRYLVFDSPHRPPASDYARVDRAALTNLYDRTTGDYLLIVPEAFAGAVGPLVTLRRSQGLDVVLAPLEVLNDAFNGGRKSPYAIRRFIRYAYDNWDARFVLLVGDGSEDPLQTAGETQAHTPLSSIDWVPTQRVLGPVPASSGGESFFQAIVSDPWYVLCVDPAVPCGATKLPDLHIGRLPVNSFDEATGVVSKLVSYESVTPDQTWRRKMVLVADDEYSGNIFGQIDAPSTYCRQSQEKVFKDISDDLRSIILNEAGLRQSEPEVFDLGSYIPNRPEDLTPCSQPPPPGACRCNGSAFIARARATATPALFTRLAEGRLWWNFQGHANETVLSHEAFYANGYNGLPDDRLALQNYGKPFLFTAFSCHPNAFGHYREYRPLPGGPSLGEEMVNLAERGAIASWASTGFELLPSSRTKHVNVSFARALFSNPPRIPQAFDPEGGARVVLGEVISKAEIDYANVPGSVSPYERDVAISYNLLGDPATRVTIGPPQAQFVANQVPVTDGVPVRLTTLADTLRLEGDLVSNARIDTIVVERIEGSNTMVIPASAYALVPAFPDTTNASGGGRRYHIVYRTTLSIGSYMYRFRTADRYGVPGRLDAVFRLQTSLHAEGGLVREGDVVSPGAALSLLLLSPASLAPATDVVLTLDGSPFAFTATAANNDASGREWNLTWAHDPYPDGSHRLEVIVQGVSAGVHAFRVESELRFQNALAFPNPFHDEGGTVFSFYLETDRPAKVALRVYAISGRLIYERSLGTLPAGYQQIPWNGVDAEGRKLGNGVYFYRIAADNGAASIRHEGRLVKLTKPRHVPDELAP